MEMFEPSSQTGATHARSTAPAILPGLCAEWRELVSSELDESCDHGAGYVYGLDVRDAAFALIRDKDLNAADVGSAVETLRIVIRHWHDLRGAYSSACEAMLVKAMPGDLVSRLPETFAEFCSAFDPGAPRDMCSERAGLTAGS
jgi:hypothetical protein